MRRARGVQATQGVRTREGARLGFTAAAITASLAAGPAMAQSAMVPCGEDGERAVQMSGFDGVWASGEIGVSSEPGSWLDRVRLQSGSQLRARWATGAELMEGFGASPALAACQGLGLGGVCQHLSTAYVPPLQADRTYLALEAPAAAGPTSSHQFMLDQAAGPVAGLGGMGEVTVYVDPCDAMYYVHIDGGALAQGPVSAGAVGLSRDGLLRQELLLPVSVPHGWGDVWEAFEGHVHLMGSFDLTALTGLPLTATGWLTADLEDGDGVVSDGQVARALGAGGGLLSAPFAVDGTLEVVLPLGPMGTLGAASARLFDASAVRETRGSHPYLAFRGATQSLQLPGPLSTLVPKTGASAELEGYYHSPSSWALSFRAELEVAWLRLTNCQVTLEPSGAELSCKFGQHGISAQVSGTLGLDGQFELQAAGKVGFPNVAGAQGSLRVSGGPQGAEARLTTSVKVKSPNVTGSFTEKVCNNVKKKACKKLGPFKKLCKTVTNKVCSTVKKTASARVTVEGQVTTVIDHGGVKTARVKGKASVAYSAGGVNFSTSLSANVSSGGHVKISGIKNISSFNLKLF